MQERPSVFLPHNEPYLGHPTLLEFDQAIPPAVRTHIRLSQSTFDRTLSPLEQAAVQLIPQAVSIALSIRELIRQGYLFSAALLLRPLIERVGLVEYLRSHPEAVQSWHNGWPRRDQPSFQTLLETTSQIEGKSEDELSFFTNVLHKLIHPDPAGALWNMITREDGKVAFSSGKILDDPEFCDFVSVVGGRFLQLVTRIAEDIFGHEV
jgi:hypothetical protein